MKRAIFKPTRRNHVSVSSVTAHRQGSHSDLSSQNHYVVCRSKCKGWKNATGQPAEKHQTYFHSLHGRTENANQIQES